MARPAARLVFFAVLVIPTVMVAGQSFKPEQKLPLVDFRSEPAPQLSITTQPGDFPVVVKHVSGSRGQTIEARARAMQVTYTKTGLTLELTNGTYSASSGPWTQAKPHEFNAMELEFSTTGELVWSKTK